AARGVLPPQRVQRAAHGALTVEVVLGQGLAAFAAPLEARGHVETRRDECLELPAVRRAVPLDLFHDEARAAFSTRSIWARIARSCVDFGSARSILRPSAHSA